MHYFLFILAVIGAVGTATGESINSIVAVVNGDSISRLQVEREKDEILRAAKGAEEKMTTAELTQAAMQSLIARHLQLQQAEALGISVPDELLAKRITVLRQEWNVADDEEFARLVKERFHTSVPRFRELLRNNILLQEVFYSQIFRNIRVSDEEITHFLQTETKIGQARAYHLRHLLIAADDDNRAAKQAQIDALRERVVNGESFAELAREHSDGENAAAGGDLQMRDENELPAIFVAAAQNLLPDEVSRVIKTARGFHLLQLIEAQSGGLRQDTEQVRLSHLFLSTEATELAAQLRQEIVNGGDFAALVKEHSIDERSVARGGDLGWFEVKDLPPYFVEVVSLLEAGDISEVFASPFGLHILRLDERQKADAEQTKEWARDVVRQRKAQEQRREWLAQLRASAYIVVLDPAYAAAVDENR